MPSKRLLTIAIFFLGSVLTLGKIQAAVPNTPKTFDSARYPAYGSWRFDTRLSNTPRYSVQAASSISPLELGSLETTSSPALRAARAALKSIRSIPKKAIKNVTLAEVAFEESPGKTKVKLLLNPPALVHPNEKGDPLVRCLSNVITEAKHLCKLHKNVDVGTIIARSLAILGVPLNTPITNLDDAPSLAQALRIHLPPKAMADLQFLAKAMFPSP